MKKTNKKGFTLVELVIVIAVIAILAAVLIPVFSDIISKAKESAALADARTVYEQYIVDAADAQESIESNLVIEVDSTHFFAVANGVFNTEPKDNINDALKLIADNATQNGTKTVNGKTLYTVNIPETETTGD